MLEGRSIRNGVLAVAIAAVASGDARAVSEPPPDPVRLGLYDWMAVAQTVIAADVIADDGKFVRAVVRASIKGALSGGAVVEIDQRRANGDRDDGVKALDLTKGRAYLLLVERSTRGKKEPYPVFDLVRGVRGAIPLPAEGSAATIDAATRLAEVEARKSDEYLWKALPEFLQDTNPVLVDAALDLYVKFRRESAALSSILQPLLENPRPDFRRRAALLLGRLLARSEAAAVPERPQLVVELSGRARRDDDPDVRREATAAIAGLPDPGVEETLRVIARDDADQDVRLTAVKSLSERAQARAAEHPH
jgi:HEAT repeats